MRFDNRVRSALRLVERARRQCDHRSGDAHISQLRNTLDEIGNELQQLLEVCEEVEIRTEVLEIIARSKDPEEALVNSLDYLTERFDFDASGLRLLDGEDFPYFTTTGFSKEFVLAENSVCSCDEHGEPVRDTVGNPVLECMCGAVIQGRVDPSRPFFTSRGSFWTNSTSTLLEQTTEEERMARTRNRCQGEGYESVALIPLSSGGQTFGLLQFNDREPGRFSPQTIDLLEDLSQYLAALLA